MALNASLDAALRSGAATVCCLLSIALPSGTIRVLDGAGEVVFGGATYRGEDATFGRLNGVESFAEAVGTEAPKVRFSFLPASLPALAVLANPLNQGSPVGLWFGAVDRATGLLIGAPEALFAGELDSVEVEGDRDTTLITFDVASAWERLFDVNEGQRLNNAFHQSIRPGELGFAFVTLIQREEPWGYDAPRPHVVADVNGGTTGGGTRPGGGGWVDLWS